MSMRRRRARQDSQNSGHVVNDLQWNLGVCRRVARPLSSVTLRIDVVAIEWWEEMSRLQQSEVGHRWVLNRVSCEDWDLGRCLDGRYVLM